MQLLTKYNNILQYYCIDITGLNKARVLAALYNASRPQGLGFMNYEPTPMTEEQAQEILDNGQTYFDYLNGRVMKINLEEDEVNTWAYNRDNGPNAAENVVEALRRINDTNSDDIQKIHQSGKASAIEHVEKHLNDETVEETCGNATVLHLGLREYRDALEPAIEKAKRQ